QESTGRVLFQEVLVDQEEGDERSHIVWVVIGRTIMRCSVHSVRPLTEVEQAVEEMRNQTNPMEWKSLTDLIPQKEYVDVVHEEPTEEDEEKVDLPKQPDASTMAPAPMRRLRWKQPRMSPGIPETKEAVDVNDYQPRSLLVDDDAGMEEDTGLGDGKPLTIGGSSSARPLLQSTSSRASADEVQEPDETRQKTDHGDGSDESAKDEETLHAELFDALDE
ncbi:unnamed protein product, partial [Effrenium voratum]